MTLSYLQNDSITLWCGDCCEILKQLPENSIDSCVCDPPYGLKFMNKEFDNLGDRSQMQKWHEQWVREVFRVLKPGGYLLVFGGSRTNHRLVCAVEDTGFEIRDSLRYFYETNSYMKIFLDSLSSEQRDLLNIAWPAESEYQWVYGSGFPKSLDVSKALDRALGAVRKKIQPGNAPAYQRSIGNTRPWMDDADHKIDGPEPVTALANQWSGWGTALKPAYEPITIARKPLIGIVVANVLKYGTGALNIDGCRISADSTECRSLPSRTPNTIYGGGRGTNLTASVQND